MKTFPRSLLKIEKGVLKKEAFSVSITLSGLLCSTEDVSHVISILKNKPNILNRIKKTPFVINSHIKDLKIVLLSHETKKGEELTEDKKEALKEISYQVIRHNISLDYSYWSTKDVIDEILPEEINRTTSFETVGHIAHLNLEKEHFPFKEIIGRVVLDKNKKIKTVVNKIGKIENKFRTFEMEILAGEHNTSTTVKENGCLFFLDISKTYWNSRLQKEHERLVSLFKRKEIVCDVFAGVGPFSIPAAKKGCIVYSNDLNIESYKMLLHNTKLNKTNIEFCQNMDGLSFLELVHKKRNELKKPDHYIMNLPSSSCDFLSFFKDKKKGQVHIYLFESSKKEAVKRVSSAIKRKIKPTNVENVRDVSPHKRMFCVSFFLD